MTPRENCKTCDGDGKICIPVYADDGDVSFEWEDCPECEEVNDIENEAIEKQ